MRDERGCCRDFSHTWNTVGYILGTVCCSDRGNGAMSDFPYFKLWLFAATMLLGKYVIVPLVMWLQGGV